MHPKYYRLEKSPPELSTYPSRKHLILLLELGWFISRATVTIVNLPYYFGSKIVPLSIAALCSQQPMR